MNTVPYIPDNAPFSAEQRAWLNGLLAGLWSSTTASAPTSTVAAARNVAVLYASQTGTSERLAKKIAKELKLKGHTARVASLEGYAPSTLAAEQCALILASTYGEGDPPDAVKPFFDELAGAAAPSLGKLEYSVLALGDRHYENFCKFGTDLDERLAALGATRLTEMVACDVDVDEPFEAWKSGLLVRLAQTEAAAVERPRIQAAPVETARYHRDQPFHARLAEKRLLTSTTSSKATVHLSFSLAGSDLTYEAGDALGVVASNDPQLVAAILRACRLTGDELVELPKTPGGRLVDALTGHLQLTRLNRKLVAAFAAAGEVRSLHALLEPARQAELEAYMHARGILDLLTEFPQVISQPQQLTDMLPKLAPRLYSISSSQKAHAAEVHATVAVARYSAHDGERGGVCSTLLAERTEPGSTVPVYIQPNKRFRLPNDPTTPIIMIGPGTGIAPFRGFLHDRCVTGATGRNWLFFGDRSASTDFLYRDELEQMLASTLLTRLDTAFSRDQQQKVYVQNRMIEQGADLFAWLESGASTYVCGDASRMAKDVDAALHAVIERHGNRDADAARDYVQNLHETGRYLRDVY